jgi:hypothetical protein
VRSPIKEWIDNLYEGGGAGTTRDQARLVLVEYIKHWSNASEAQIDDDCSVWAGDPAPHWLTEEELLDFSDWLEDAWGRLKLDVALITEEPSDG